MPDMTTDFSGVVLGDTLIHDKMSNGEEVIIASVQSLVRRLNKFSKDYFDMIIIDERTSCSSAYI